MATDLLNETSSLIASETLELQNVRSASEQHKARLSTFQQKPTELALSLLESLHPVSKTIRADIDLISKTKLSEQQSQSLQRLLAPVTSIITSAKEQYDSLAKDAGTALEQCNENYSKCQKSLVTLSEQEPKLVQETSNLVTRREAHEKTKTELVAQKIGYEAKQTEYEKRKKEADAEVNPVFSSDWEKFKYMLAHQDFSGHEYYGLSPGMIQYHEAVLELQSLVAPMAANAKDLETVDSNIKSTDEYLTTVRESLTLVNNLRDQIKSLSNEEKEAETDLVEIVKQLNGFREKLGHFHECFSSMTAKEEAGIQATYRRGFPSTILDIILASPMNSQLLPTIKLLEEDLKALPDGVAEDFSTKLKAVEEKFKGLG